VVAHDPVSEITVELEFSEDKKQAMIIFQSAEEIHPDDLLSILKTMVSEDSSKWGH